MDKFFNKTPESFKITGDWNKLSKKLKERFPKLTDSDLEFEAGKENQLLTIIETRLDKKRTEVINILKTN